MKLGSWLKRQREQHEITLNTAARLAGISTGFLSEMENNIRMPSAEVYIRLCNVYDQEASNDVLHLLARRKADLINDVLTGRGYLE